jgi:RND family efflux transporter MFP subunit
VGVTPVVRDSISEIIPLTGRLTPVPGGSALLAAPVDAVVESTPVQLGQAVTPGQLLVRLNAPELVTAARSQAAQARSDSLDLERQRELFRQGITARRQLEEREAAAAGSRAAAEAASQLLLRTEVTSPISGGVQRLLVQLGERVAAGQPLVEVVSARDLDFHAGVPAEALGRIRLGQTVTVSPSGAGPAATGRVTAIAPAVDSSSGLGEIVVRIAGTNGLRAGTGGTGRLQLRLLRDALVIPEAALVPADSGLQVFVVGADSIARGRAVQVLARTAARVAVQGELAPGDRVVVNGAYGLSDSTRVVPTPAP